jgi:hypothetical protein
MIRRFNTMAVLVIGACAAMLGGCSTPSINAVYSDDEHEITTDDRIVGYWAEDGKDTKTRYEVGRRADEKTNWYPVKILGAGPDKEGGFELRLVKLGAHTYADFYPDQGERSRISDRLALAGLPMHVVYPVVISDEGVRMRPLDMEKVRALIRETPQMTPHAVRGDTIILTGDTRQVQEFFRKVVETDDLFATPMELVRSTAPEATDSGIIKVPDNTRSGRPGYRGRR